MMYSFVRVAVASALFTAGCATPHPTMARTMKEDVPLPLVLESRAGGGAVTAFSQQVQGTASPVVKDLTLADALGFALRSSPALKGFASEIRARDAAALQAGLMLNPELNVELENFSGQDELQGLDGAETTIAFSQVIELGDKRGKRRQLAMNGKDLAVWDYQSKKLDLLAATARAFIEVLVAQEQVALNNELVSLAEKTAKAVGERVDAGKESPVEKTRTQVELAAARTEAATAARGVEAAKRRLSSFWGAERVEFGKAVGDLSDISPLPTEESLRTFLESNPDLARWESEIGGSETALALARAEAVPDLTVSAGVRNFQETDNNALVFGLSFPIPLFNRNQGAIEEARANLARIEQEQAAARVDVQARLADTWLNLAVVHAEASTLRAVILPGAQEAYESTEIGYREGKLDFLQMLDAQRTLFNVRKQYLQALGTYHATVTDLERLIGVSLKSLQAQAAGKIE